MRVWIGERYSETRILVLGESWYGTYSDQLVTDHGYISAYLRGEVADAMYTRMANACGMSTEEFWQGVMFTNFVQRVGETRDARPTPAHYAEAVDRLQALLREHQPRGVWILGVGQATHSAPVVTQAGIPFEVTPHPTSYGLTNARLGESWHALMAAVGHAQLSEPTSVQSRATPGTAPALARFAPDAAPDGFVTEEGMNVEDWGGYQGRDQDTHQRKWRAFGFGGKTAPKSTWRWWDVGREGSEKAYVIRAPFDLAEYRLVNRRLYYGDELIVESETQWLSTWAALAHFYEKVVPGLKGPPLAGK